MASAIRAFDAFIDNDDGTVVGIAGAAVEVYHVPASGPEVRLLPDLVADGDGVVASGALDVPAGSVVRFAWQDDTTGQNAFAEQVTE